MGNAGPILSSQYMTQFSVLENILTNLLNFLGHHNSILLKNISFSCGNHHHFHIFAILVATLLYS